jgi:hypothetical protein
MYRFRIYNRIKFVCFLKFIVHEMNSEMAKSGMMVLIERERTDMADADVAVDCCSLLSERWWARGREKAYVMWVRLRYSLMTTETRLITTYTISNKRT